MFSETNEFTSDSVVIQIGRLRDNLARQRCLILLDDAEEILQDREIVGKYRQEYEDYDKLFNIFALWLTS